MSHLESQEHKVRAIKIEVLAKASGGNDVECSQSPPKNLKSFGVIVYAESALSVGSDGGEYAQLPSFSSLITMATTLDSTPSI